jgi:hypothetical protein
MSVVQFPEFYGHPLTDSVLSGCGTSTYITSIWLSFGANSQLCCHFFLYVLTLPALNFTYNCHLLSIFTVSCSKLCYCACKLAVTQCVQAGYDIVLTI